MIETEPPWLLGFHALDLHSGCNLRRGYKPALRDEHETMQGLKNREMIFLLVDLLTSVGFRQAGCTLICEKGTANVPDWVLQIFHDFGLTQLRDELDTVQRRHLARIKRLSANYAASEPAERRFQIMLEHDEQIEHHQARGHRRLALRRRAARGHAQAFLGFQLPIEDEDARSRITVRRLFRERVDEVAKTKPEPERPKTSVTQGGRE